MRSDWRLEMERRADEKGAELRSGVSDILARKPWNDGREGDWINEAAAEIERLTRERDAALHSATQIAASCGRADQDNARLTHELARLRDACTRENDEICQTLGRALGYPRFKDDQNTFPGADEETGVFVGEHVAVTIASEAAARIERLTRELAEARRRYADFYDQQIGTPCAEIRWHQEREELTRELAEARAQTRKAVRDALEDVIADCYTRATMPLTTATERIAISSVRRDVQDMIARLDAEEPKP